MEDADSILSVIKDCSDIQGDISYIPLSPEALYTFERSHIPYTPIRDYHWDKECEHQGMENFRRIDRLSAILDKELENLHSIPGLTPVRYSIFNLKIFFDVLWTTILTLKKIIGTENPDFIRLYTSRNIRSNLERYAFSNDESVYSEVLLLEGWHIPVRVIRTGQPDKEEPDPAHGKSSLKNQIVSWIKNRDFLFNLGMIYKREGLQDCVKSFFYSLKPWHNKPVLVYNSGYNWDDSLDEFFRRGIYPIHRITDASLKKDLKGYPDFCDDVQKIYVSIKTLREFDHILGINVASVMLNRLSQIIATSIRESTGSYEIIRKMIQDKKIRALILTTRERPAGHAIVQAAHDAGIPVISWQHGGGGYADFLMMPYIEFINSDWHFVFGEKVAEKFTYAAKVCRFDTLPLFFTAGSSSLDHLWRKKNKSRANQEHNKIVYITTDYHRNLYIISYPFNPFFLDEHLWNIQKRIMEMAKNNPDRDFVIKLHPAHTDKEPLKSYVRDHNINNITLITSEKTLPELLDSADFVIIDHIATGILQVLTLKVPVFAYTGLYTLDLDAELMLKKCAYVSDNLDDLFENVEKYILTKTMSDHLISLDNCEFLKNYGTDIHSLNSAEKAAIKLNEIIG